MNNYYVSKQLISRASQRRPAMDATVRSYRATWGWIVAAALLAAGILVLLTGCDERSRAIQDLNSNRIANAYMHGAVDGLTVGLQLRDGAYTNAASAQLATEQNFSNFCRTIRP